MKFSIIIPAYNAQNSLYACLQSVQNQTYQNYEAIIVDDGSTDDTPQIAKRFSMADARFRCVHQNNSGVSAARNHGLSMASGEFLCFLDSDDRYVDTYLQEFYTMISDNPECDLFCCGYRRVDSINRVIGDTVWSEDSDRCCVLPRTQIMGLHEKTLDAALWNKAYRRKIIETHNLHMDEDLSLGEDMLFNYAYFDVCAPLMVICNKALYLYTKAEDGTLDSKYRPDLKEIYLKINGQVFSYLKRWNLDQAQMGKFYDSAFFRMEKVLYNTFRKECTMTLAEKIHFNNDILSSDYFKTLLEKRTCEIHPLYHIAYRVAKWEVVMMLNNLLTLKKAVTRK